MDFFSVSKLFWILADPGNFLVLLIVLGLLLQFVPRVRTAGVVVTGLGAVGMVLVFLLPIGLWLLAPLENRFPVPRLPERVDGIVVLGGVTRNDVSAARGTPQLQLGAERLTKATQLANEYPAAKIVIAGGSGEIDPEGSPEAVLMREVMVDLGVNPERILLDDKSRNTYENAVEAKRVADPKPGEIWLLVTSAYQMPRAVGAFRKVGFDVVPYPVDFRTPAEHRRHLDHLLSRLATGEKEWIGLLAYYLTDKTSALFPKP
ncbi:uncharacterized SAM-binding protein YcdF (DUF218 family) [Rhodoligotrophos appendicifer]|uniref:YdcF family protein n=1 Tax=Rhodoligotrophos appendicifer TaxID=987056 RepID=UPI001478E984|nr:YdcF family protein [Rhodoligotrophos appendicifer]